MEDESIKKTMAGVLLKDFEKHWGKAVDPVWSEEVQHRFGQRQIKSIQGSLLPTLIRDSNHCLMSTMLF
jgi:hypothetical protein